MESSSHQDDTLEVGTERELTPSLAGDHPDRRRLAGGGADRRPRGDTHGLIAFLQRLVGMGLTGLVQDHILSIWRGLGANGKTTLLKALPALLGLFVKIAPLSLLLEAKHVRSNIPNDGTLLAGTNGLLVAKEAMTPAQRNAVAALARVAGLTTTKPPAPNAVIVDAAKYGQNGHIT